MDRSGVPAVKEGKAMAKFKAGDRVVLEISDVEMIGPIEHMYVTTNGVRIRVSELDKEQDFEERCDALKKALTKAKKPAAKKTAKKAEKKA